MNDILTTILFLWASFGALIFTTISISYYHPLDKRCILRPDWVFDSFDVNIFGSIILILLFNFLCPIITVFYWCYKFIYFIFTVGISTKNMKYNMDKKTDNLYNYKVEKVHVFLLPRLSKFSKFLWKIRGYKITELSENSDTKNNEKD